MTRTNTLKPFLVRKEVYVVGGAVAPDAIVELQTVQPLAFHPEWIVLPFEIQVAYRFVGSALDAGSGSNPQLQLIADVGGTEQVHEKSTALPTAAGEARLIAWEASAKPFDAPSFADGKVLKLQGLNAGGAGDVSIQGVLTIEVFAQEEAPFSPLSLGGLGLWLDMLDPQSFFEVSGTVPSIRNKASGAVWEEAINPPGYDPVGLNGLPCMTGDGAAARIISTETAVVSAMNDAQGYTLFVACFTLDPDALKTLFSAANSAVDANTASSRSWRTITSGNGGWTTQWLNDVGTNSGQLERPNAATTQPVVLIWSNEGGADGNEKLYLDEETTPDPNTPSDPSAGGTQTLTTDRVALFCTPDNNPGSFFEGGLGEIFRVSREVSETERWAAQTYLLERWKIGAGKESGADPPADPASLAAIVTPLGVSSAALQYEPEGTIAEFIDGTVIPQLNALAPGNDVRRRLSKLHGGRCVHLVLANNPYMQTAPLVVRNLAASLPVDSPQTYVRHAEAEGDIWFVSVSTEGLRHACYELLEAQGVIQLAAHPDWLEHPTAAVPHPTLGSVSGLRSPRMGYVSFKGNGGLTAPVTIPGQSESAAYWRDWPTQTRCPREYQKSAPGLAGGGFLKRYQCQIRADRSWLAWDPKNAQRGYASNSFPDFPTTCFDSASFRIQKMCGTHNGVVAGGAYPPLSGGDTPWVGVALQAPGCTEGGPECVEPPADPNDDNPDTPLHDDLVTWDGGIAARSEYVFAVACETIQANGETHPASQLVTAANPDGGANCLCNKCRDLLRTFYNDPGQPDATRADQDHFRVKRIAEYLEYRFQNSRSAMGAVGGRVSPLVLQRAYSEVIDPPAFALPSNLLVRLVVDATGAYTTRTKEELVTDWFARAESDGFRLGATPSWGLSNAPAFDLPLYSAQYTLSRMRDWIDRGLRDINMETSFGNCAYGWLFWCIQKMNWGDDRDWEEILDEFFAKAYGPIVVPVRRMYDRWWRGVQWSYSVASQAWADLDEAQSILDGMSDPAPYQERLKHVVGWVNFMRRYAELEASCNAFDEAVGGGTSESDLEQAWDRTAYACWSIVEWNAIHAQNIGANLRAVTIRETSPTTGTQRLASNNPYNEKWEHNDSNAPGWATLSLPTTADCRSMIAAGLSETPWIQDIRENDFSEDLVAVMGTTDQTPVATIYTAIDQRYSIIKPTGDITIDVQLSPDGSAVNAPVRIFLYDWEETQVLASWDVWAQVGMVITQGLTLQVPSGRYRIMVSHNGGASCIHRFQVQRRYPFAMRLAPVQKGFDQAKRVYCLVPETEPRLALSIHKKNPLTPVQFYDSSGAQVATTQLKPFTFVADVPPTERGTVWSWTGWHSAYGYSAPVAHNFSPWVSFDEAQVLVPAELLM